MKLEIGDIIGYKPLASSSFIAALVKLGARQRHSHVMLYIGDDQIIEAGKGGVEIRKFRFNDVKDQLNWSLSRVKDGLTPAEGDDLYDSAKAFAEENHPYAFYQGFTMFLYKWFNKNKLIRKLLSKLFKLNDDYFMNCGELINRIYEKSIGLDLSPEHIDFTAPDDVTYLKSKFLKKIW
jgi:uncharacterized protein YycO